MDASPAGVLILAQPRGFCAGIICVIRAGERANFAAGVIGALGQVTPVEVSTFSGIQENVAFRLPTDLAST